METETKIRKTANIESLNRLADEISPLAEAFNQMNDHVVITDENGNIVFANKAVERQTGFKINEILGKNPGDLWGSKMPKSFYEEMWYRIKILKEPFIGEVQNERKDGSAYWQELRVTPVLNKEGEAKYFIGIEPNISKKKILEKTRENFLAVFDKRMQNSFTGVRQALDWLYTSGKLTQKQQEKLESVYKTQQNLSILISDLLSFLKNSNSPETAKLA